MTLCISNLSSPNYSERTLPVSFLILHYTGMRSAQDALDRMMDSAAQVSAHYCIDVDGKIYGLVDEKLRAHHAGVSYWQGVRDINSASIGIELVNKGHEFGYHAFDDRQIDALIELSQDILSRHNIKYVLGHSDIAPTRKQDPGELFPWKKLAQYGIGFWTDEYCETHLETLKMLKDIGYDTTDENAVLLAFQRHFYPQAIIDDGDKTKQRIAAVLKGINHDL